MKGNATDVSIDPNITYSLKNNSFNKPLKLTNHSPHTYVFKIKTNQKTVVSLHITHDFLTPNSTREIPIKLADKPTETSALKLEFNYALASEEDIANKDSKMTSYGKESTFKKVITIERKDDVQSEDKQANKTQKIEVQPLDKNFSSPVKITSSIRENPKYPSVQLAKSEAAKIQSPKLDKSEEIDISELIKMQKSTEIQAPKQEEAPPKVEPPKEAPKKIELVFESLNLKKTQSIESQPKEIKPAVPPTNVLDSSRDLSTFVAMRGPESSDHTFRMTESVIVDVPTQTVSQKNEKQIVLSQLTEKISKQKRTIKTLRVSSQKQLSVYPLPLILAIIIGGFCLGSLLNWTMHSV